MVQSRCLAMTVLPLLIQQFLQRVGQTCPKRDKHNTDLTCPVPGANRHSRLQTTEFTPDMETSTGHSLVYRVVQGIWSDGWDRYELRTGFRVELSVHCDTCCNISTQCAYTDIAHLVLKKNLLILTGVPKLHTSFCKYLFEISGASLSAGLR